MTSRGAMLYRIACELGVPMPWRRWDSPTLLVAATRDLDYPVYGLLQRCRLADEGAVYWPVVSAFDKGALCLKLDRGANPRRVAFAGDSGDAAALVALHHVLDAVSVDVPEELAAESSRLLVLGTVGVLPGPWPPRDASEEPSAHRDLALLFGLSKRQDAT